MSRGINQVTLVGHVGSDPTIRAMPSGSAVANLRLATSEKWKDKQTGEDREQTEWHTIVIFGKLAEVVEQYVKKGQQLLLQGKIRTRKWQDREGNDRYSTEIVCDTMLMLGGRGSGGGTGQSGGSRGSAGSSRGPSRAEPQAEPAGVAESFDDDIPF